MDADAACRGFSVTIISNEELDSEKRAVEDVSYSDSDSDSTETGEQEKGETVTMIPSTMPDKL